MQQGATSRGMHPSVPREPLSLVLWWDASMCSAAAVCCRPCRPLRRFQTAVSVCDGGAVVQLLGGVLEEVQQLEQENARLTAR